MQTEHLQGTILGEMSTNNLAGNKSAKNKHAENNLRDNKRASIKHVRNEPAEDCLQGIIVRGSKHAASKRVRNKHPENDPQGIQGCE
jgi:hypothetical protein